MSGNLLSIGAAAARAGVSVQTLRHYDKLGLLRPSAVTSAGYRCYSEGDCARLELIRTLRAAGFDLDTIGRLIKNTISVAAAIQLQLDALGVQARALQRQQAVLRAVATQGADAQGGEAAMLARLQRLQVLARLDVLEREAFLAGQLHSVYEARRADPDILRAATADLPEAMDDAQLDAWFELAEIAADPEFHAVLRRQTSLFDNSRGAAAAAWAASSRRVMQAALEALAAAQAPDDPAVVPLIAAWVRDFAAATGRRPALRKRATEMLAHMLATNDARIERYWRALARLRKQPYSDAFARALPWLLDALRAFAARAPSAQRGAKN